jgi:hypothetical protein
MCLLKFDEECEINKLGVAPFPRRVRACPRRERDGAGVGVLVASHGGTVPRHPGPAHIQTSPVPNGFRITKNYGPIGAGVIGRYRTKPAQFGLLRRGNHSRHADYRAAFERGRDYTVGLPAGSANSISAVRVNLFYAPQFHNHCLAVTEMQLRHADRGVRTDRRRNYTVI